jgi:hypothetical protein
MKMWTLVKLSQSQHDLVLLSRTLSMYFHKILLNSKYRLARTQVGFMHAWGSLNNGLLVLHFRPPLSHSILLLLLPPTAVSQLPPPRSHRA